MPRVFRLIKARFLATPLAGGSALRGERWNPVGVDVLYTSSSPELALVEVLASLMPIRLDELPTYYLVTIQIPDQEAIRPGHLRGFGSAYQSVNGHRSRHQFLDDALCLGKCL